MQEFQPIDLQQLRSDILDKSSALVEYFLTDEFLYSIFVDKNDIRFHRTKLTNNLPEQITALLDNRQYTTDSQLKAFAQVHPKQSNWTTSSTLIPSLMPTLPPF